MKTGRKPTHGHRDSGSRSSEYMAWDKMIQRCNNPNCCSYKNYGARGIKVSEEWTGVDGFSNFIADMGLKPSKSHSLDRFPNNDSGNYEKGNCRWATQIEQQNNRRSNVFLFHQGERMTVAQWAVRLGIPARTIYTRLKQNLPVYLALYKNQIK